MKNVDQLRAVAEAAASAIIAQYPHLEAPRRSAHVDDLVTPTVLGVRVQFAGLRTVWYRAPVSAWYGWNAYDVAVLVRPVATLDEQHDFHQHILSPVGDRFEHDNWTNHPELPHNLSWDSA